MRGHRAPRSGTEGFLAGKVFSIELVFTALAARAEWRSYTDRSDPRGIIRNVSAKPE
jgi:hypothetical protein